MHIFSKIDIPSKPEHPLSRGREKLTALIEYRKHYDEFIAEVDSEVGLLVDALDRAGILKNTYLFILADHGELFERGEQGHITPLIYDPVLHIPLIVYAPGQKSRRDVFSPTSNVDILPTILKILGNDSPPAMDGKVLPGFGGKEDDERSRERGPDLGVRVAPLAPLSPPNPVIYHGNSRRAKMLTMRLQKEYN